MRIKSYFFMGMLFVSAVAQAQQNTTYKIPKPSRFDLLAPYKSVQIAEPSFANTARIDKLIRNGELRLSLDDAIALALENNLDLAIARYNLVIADTDLMRTKSGASVRGVATGLVQGTPGGGIGGFGTGAPGAGAGGTSGGAGGAGSGASGLVQSTLGTGANIQSFDPQISGNFNLEHSVTPLSNTVTTGVPLYQQNLGLGGFSYQQAFATGTSMDVGFNGSRATDNGIYSALVPQLNSGFRLTLTQRLLSGFGPGPNMRFIRIAKNNREISDIAFKNQVIATVSQIQNIYWDLVNAYENVRVRERSLSLADKTLADNREQVRIGAIPAIEITKAENDVAARNQDLILAQTQLQLQQLLIKNAVTRDIDESAVAEAVVVPTDTMQIPDKDQVVPVQDLVSQAIGSRAELAQARIDLTNRKISRKAASNALLPDLSVSTWYGAAGLAGQQNPKNTDIPPGSIPGSGFGDAFSRLFKNDFPDYGVGVTLNIPLRNRAAKADQIRSELEYRQAQMRLQQLRNQISIEVRNAQFAVQQNRARVETSRKARDLAARTFDIEQKKHVLGASTSNEVLAANRDLMIAESTLVAAMSDYMKSVVELDRSTGNTLDHLGIKIGDAENGVVGQEPNVPGVVPRTDIQTGPTRE
jgi:outer membrane protein TolC